MISLCVYVKMYITRIDSMDAHAVLLSLNCKTDISEGNPEGNWDLQQQGGSQEHLGAEARVQTLSAH